MACKIRNFLAISSALTAGLIGDTALAQDSGDIIVTARRVEERLQDVPISITVFNQQQLSDRNVSTAADLATYTPSLAVDARFGAESGAFAIRGFTKELRTTSSVGVYFADVVAPRGGTVGTGGGDGLGAGAFFDLQNVQVLKGPQGTLFGRNTTGGAVLLVPNKPGSEFGGYVEGSIGNHDLRRIQAVLNVPLSETVRLRLGVDRQKRDGYLNNISGIGPRDFNDVNYVSARASLVIDLTPDLENYTIGTYSKVDQHGSQNQIFAVNPSAGLFALMAGPQLARQQGLGFYTVQNNLPNAAAKSRQWQIINTTTWRASDALTVKNIIRYAEFRAINRQEVFGSRFVTPSFFGPLGNLTINFAATNPLKGQFTSDQSTFSEELQFQGQAGSKLTWQAGVYYELSKPLSRVGSRSTSLINCTDPVNLVCTDVLSLAFGLPSGTIGSASDSYGTVKYTDLGVYGQASYAFTEKLKLTAGMRYTHDKTVGDSEILTYRFLNPANPAQVTASCTDPRGSLANNCRLAYSQKSEAPTWLLDLDYKPVEDMLLYAKWARGYRQGSVNAFAPAGFASYGPEKVDLYELGAKTSFDGAVKGSLNVAAFYNNFRNQQLQVGAQSSRNAGPQTTAIINAGKSRIWGVEIDGSLSPADFLRFDLGYAYLNTKLLKAQAVIPPPGSVYDIFSFTTDQGGPLPFTPKNKLNATATIILPVSENLGKVSLSGTYSYSDAYRTSARSSTPSDSLEKAIWSTST